MIFGSNRMISYELQVVSWYFKKINLRVLSYFWELQSQKNKFTSSRLYFSSCLAVLRVENLFYVLKTFFMNCFLFESRALLISNTFITNLKLRFGCDFLPNPLNINLFVKWNKQKERARRDMHFCDIESKTPPRKFWKFYKRPGRLFEDWEFTLHAPYILAEWKCLVYTSSRFAFFF